MEKLINDVRNLLIVAKPNEYTVNKNTLQKYLLQSLSFISSINIFDFKLEDLYVHEVQ